MKERRIYHSFTWVKEGRWVGAKNKAVYLKTRFSFFLKTAEKLETPKKKEQLCTCQSKKTVDLSESYPVYL